jgi:hypothetical protein
MNKSILLFIISFAVLHAASSQPVQGVLVQNTNPYILKVWGNHYERGYAMGYLLGEQIADIYGNYVAPQFGTSLPMAKLMIQQGLFSIDSVFISEAHGVIDGITDAGYNPGTMDYLDVLIGNTFLDFQNISSFKNKIQSPGCSSLISWGNATAASELGGKSIITRHLDWSTETCVLNNQAIIIHFPTDPGEQPWLLIGFAGQMGVLSGLNQSGLGVFQHSMSDSYSPGNSTQHYEPVWFFLRRAIEQTDINGDGVSNTLDMRAAAVQNINGFADGYIISAIAPNTFSNDSLCAMIAELAPAAPLHTFRDNSFPDSIPGSNIYAANYEIKRNNHMHFCFRYNQTKNAVDAISGQHIGKTVSWTIMADSSNAGFGNVQMIQYIPEDNELYVAFHPGDAPAYENTPVFFDLVSLFSPTSLPAGYQNPVSVFPNPASEYLHISGYNNEEYSFCLYNLQGKELIQKTGLSGNGKINISRLKAGMYVVKICGQNLNYSGRIVVEK